MNYTKGDIITSLDVPAEQEVVFCRDEMISFAHVNTQLFWRASTDLKAGCYFMAIPVPEKTIGDKVFEDYPKARKHNPGYGTSYFCPSHLGYENICPCTTDDNKWNCSLCWSQPLSKYEAAE